MPVFKSLTAIELVRGMKVFLNLEAGLTRGEIPTRAPSVSGPLLPMTESSRAFASD